MDVLVQVKRHASTIHGLGELTSTEGLLVVIVHAAKLEAVLQDEQPLRKARRFSLGFTSILSL